MNSELSEDEDEVARSHQTTQEDIIPEEINVLSSAVLKSLSKESMVRVLQSQTNRSRAVDYG